MLLVCYSCVVVYFMKCTKCNASKTSSMERVSLLTCSWSVLYIEHTDSVVMDISTILVMDISTIGPKS